MSNIAPSFQAINWIACEEQIHRGDGLPTHQIHRINLFDNKVWMATASGLAIYDGEAVRVLNRKNKLLSHGLRSVGEAKAYALICSDSGIDWLNRRNFQVEYQLNTAAKGWGLCEGAAALSPEYFLLGCTKGLNLVELKGATIIHQHSWLEGEYISALASNNHGICLLKSNKSGLWSYQDLQVKPIVSRKLSNLGHCQKIRFTDDQFLITLELGIAILDNLLHVSKVILLPKSLTPVLSFFPVNDDYIWVATSDGLFGCKTDDPVNIVIDKFYLHHKQINDIAMDHSGNLWCASEHSGLFKIPVIEKWINLCEPVSNNSYLSLRKLDQLILVGGTLQSFILDRANEQYKLLTELEQVQVWDLIAAPPLKQIKITGSENTCHELWAATSRGVSILKSPDYEKQDIEFYHPCRCLYFIEHYVLVGSVTGLYLYDRKSSKINPLHYGRDGSVGYVYSIHSVDNLSIYICTLGRGLWRLDWIDRKLEPIDLGADYANIYSVVFQGNDLLAISADDHILKCNGKSFITLYQSSLSVAAWVVEKYDDDSLLLGTSEGLQVLDLKSGEITFTLDQFPNGSYWEFTTSRSIIRINQKVWCGLNDYLSIVDVKQLRDIIPPIQPKIVDLTLGTSSLEIERKLSIKEGDWILKVDLSCHWYWSKSSVKYQYRLLGLSSNWIQLMGNQVILTGLNPGQYLLEVDASCNFSKNQEFFQLLEIDVVPVRKMVFALHMLKKFMNRIFDYFENQKLMRTNRAKLHHLESTIKQRTELLNQANEKLEHQNKILTEMSTTDPLTGLFNRRYFLEQALKEVKRAVRSQLPMCLLMIDIDHFKQYNDHYGHKQGDVCLQQVALKIRRSFNRSSDLTARYGGEEFIVLLAETSLEDAKLAVEKCLQNIRNSGLEHAKSLTASFVTISLGIACETPQYDFDQKSTMEFINSLIEKADKNLYLAKNNGRNTYFVDP